LVVLDRLRGALAAAGVVLGYYLMYWFGAAAGSPTSSDNEQGCSVARVLDAILTTPTAHHAYLLLSALTVVVVLAAEFAAAYNRQDAERVASFFDEDGVAKPPNRPMNRGKSAIAAVLRRNLKRVLTQ
jgi:hypothetical protein